MEENQNLASVERITGIKDIQNADFIQLAFVLGYQSVIKKGEYKVGDLVVFVQPDTLLPRKNWNKFLWPKGDENTEGEPIRLRSAKFKSALSQGLIISCDNLPIDCAREEGKDVTSQLNIAKYSKPLPCELVGVAKGGLPWGIPKTDEINLRNKARFLDEIKGERVIISLKMDGSSGLFAWNNGEFAVCSRQINLCQSKDNAFWQIAEQYKLQDNLGKFGNFAINGEVCGPKLNGNKIGLNNLHFFAFNLFDIDKHQYLNHDKLTEICLALNLPRVQVIFDGKSDFSLESLTELCDALNYRDDPNFPCEGIVIRTAEEKYSDVLKGRASAKLISQRFLAKYKE